METADFFYELPREAIAQRPVTPRHAARLLDTRDLTDGTFLDLPGLLDPGDLVVVNSTRVRAARLRGRKAETGGAVELLLLDDGGDGRWEALVRPARRIHAGTRLAFGSLEVTVETEPREGTAVVRFGDGVDVEAAVAAMGEVPLPPYITEGPVDPDDYQTIFAERVGSAAAPTAGLHISDAVLAEFERHGVGVATLDLSVGLDTFRPISEPRLEDHRMHRERYTIPEATAEKIGRTRSSGGRIVALGTTVVRAIESAVTDGQVVPGSAETDLFITPGHEFFIDGLVTNFHVPGSTLIVMIAAFVGHRWRMIYETALERGYRFLSFGDAMYAERS